MKQQLLDQITEDYINGDICSDAKATFEFIKDLVNLLDDDAVEAFAAMYEYDIKTKYWDKVNRGLNKSVK